MNKRVLGYILRIPFIIFLCVIFGIAIGMNISMAIKEPQMFFCLIGVVTCILVTSRGLFWLAERGDELIKKEENE